MKIIHFILFPELFKLLIAFFLLLLCVSRSWSIHSTRVREEKYGDIFALLLFQGFRAYQGQEGRGKAAGHPT